jgi:voltage-gated potassium channel
MPDNNNSAFNENPAVSVKKKKPGWYTALQKFLTSFTDSMPYHFVIFILAIASVAFAVMEVSGSLTERLLEIDEMIFIVFTADYWMRFVAADSKITFFKHNLLDFVAILPFHVMFKFIHAHRALKVLKLVQFGRVARLGALFARLVEKSREFLHTSGIKYILILCISAILAASVAMMYLEKMSFVDALWWSFVTTTTVGYGDLSPVTGAGRIIASILMIVGIGLISSLTSSITRYFIDTSIFYQTPSSDKVYMVQKLYEELTPHEQQLFLNSLKPQAESKKEMPDEIKTKPDENKA